MVAPGEKGGWKPGGLKLLGTLAGVTFALLGRAMLKPGGGDGGML